MYRIINITNYLGNLKQQEKLKMCVNDLKLGNNIRGWIKQELNSVSRKSTNKNNRVKKRLKVPPGYVLAHQRGREKVKGFGYEHSNLMLKLDHKIQPKFNKSRHFEKIYINNTNLEKIYINNTNLEKNYINNTNLEKNYINNTNLEKNYK